MKILKTTLILTIISCLTFSCSSDDSSLTEDNQSKIIGTWILTAETENGANITLDVCDSIIEITSTQVNSNSYYGDNCSMTDTYTSNYSISGNIITTTEDGETFNSEIVTLNSTTLKIKSSYVEDGETYNYTETYTRQ